MTKTRGQPQTPVKHVPDVNSEENKQSVVGGRVLQHSLSSVTVSFKTQASPRSKSLEVQHNLGADATVHQHYCDLDITLVPLH